ncbi:MAG: hypothetical protein HEEMFOPI_01217 [Holosporales bacterium]
MQDSISKLYNLIRSLEKDSPRFFEDFSCRFLGFRRLFTNGQLFCLTNEPFLTEFVFKNNYWYSEKCFLELELFAKMPVKSLTTLWDDHKSNENISLFLQKNNCSKGIYIFKKMLSCIDTYAFSFDDRAYHHINLILKNQNLLDISIINFLNFINKFLFSSVYYIKTDYYFKIKEQITPFDDLSKSFKVNLIIDNSEVSISKRELQILKLLSMGKTMKEIANLFNLSPRTVEVHIKNLKWKTKSLTTGTLIDLYWRWINFL